MVAPKKRRQRKDTALATAIVIALTAAGPLFAQYDGGSGAGGGGAPGSPGASPSPSATAGAGAAESRVILTATLTGQEEVPSVTTSASGVSVVMINPSRTEIEYALATDGLQGIVAAHIHSGSSGVAGPVIFTLSGGSFDGSLAGSLSAADFTPAPGFGINTFEDALAAISCGNTYVNVHTVANPNGEIRGQLRDLGTVTGSGSGGPIVGSCPGAAPVP